MKILHITDSHGTVKNPAGRKDIYYISFLEKFYELSYIIKQQNIDMIIHTGDMFHTSRVSDKFAGQLAEILKIYQIPFYVVPGNHDIDGYNLDTIDQTKLGLLYKTGIISELDRDNSINITTNTGNPIKIHIEGQEFCTTIDGDSQDEYQMKNTDGDLNILCVHGYLTNVHQPDGVRCTYVDDLLTNADIILSGHWHRKICYETDDLAIYNPGSMMRVEQTEYNKNHKPQYGILEINEDGYTYTFHDFLIAKDYNQIFDYNAKYAAKQNQITLDNFKNSFTNGSSKIVTQYTPGKTILSSLQDIVSDVIDNSTEQYVHSLKQDALDEVSDAFNDPAVNVSLSLNDKGYIPNPSMDSIASVHIHNFQSHKDTTIDFKDGLNTILGESNSGKTSIIRAMLWCIYNKPNGSDFITTGQNECSVEIVLNSGYTIKRTRTAKDTGTYEVSFAGTSKVYKGFSNNIPIEIKNVFQMPTVAISKDINTNLNVMTQLENSFMISDSPQQRAIMIGRLTGVNVIDSIIKKNNSGILNKRSMIRHIEESLAKEEEELKNRVNLKKIEIALVDVHAVESYIHITSDTLQLIQDKLNQHQSINADINAKKAELCRLEKLLFIESFITGLDHTHNAITKLEDLISKYSDLQIDINSIKDRLKRCEPLSKLKDFPDKLLDVFNKFNGIKGIVDGIDNVAKEIINKKDALSKMKSIANSSESIVKCIEYFVNLNKIESLIDLHHQIIEQVEAMEQESNNLSNEIEFNKKELLNLYMKDDRCPCCGRSCKSASRETQTRMIDFLLSH